MKKEIRFFFFILFCSGVHLLGMKLKKSPHEKITKKIERINAIISTNRQRIQIPGAPVFALAFNNDGTYLAIATQEERAIGQKMKRVPVATIVEKVDFHGGGRSEVGREIYKDIPVVETQIDNIIRIINIGKAKRGQSAQEKVLRSHTGKITALIFNPLVNLLISGSEDKSIKLWDVAQGVELGAVTISRSPITSLAASASFPQEVVVGSADRNIYQVDTHTRTILRTIPGHKDQVTGVSISSDGTMIASSSYDKSVRINTKNGEFKKRLIGACPVQAVAFNPRNNLQLVSGGWDKIVHRWNPNTAEDEPLSKQAHKIFSIAYSADGAYIAVGSRYETNPPQAEHAARSRQPEPVCGGIPGTIEIPLRILFRIGDDMITLELPGHTADVHAVTFSPVSGKLASASIDGTVLLWNIPRIAAEVEQLYRNS